MEAINLAEKFPRATKVALITDTNVDRLWGDVVVREIEATGLRVDRIVIPEGEASKTLETYAKLVRSLAQLEYTRCDLLMALGGGVVCDLTGFAAATYMRGIDWVAMPTTLLAMVDASVGGKTGVDIPEGKNLVGAFWRPALTIRQPRFLETLSESERRNGLAEMLKMRIISGCELEIESCVAAKQRIVDEDFREAGARQFLNLGHTFGHAIELVSDFLIPHGAAVAMGMRIVSQQAPDVLRLLDDHGFHELPLPPTNELLAAIRSDKKRCGDQVTLVIPRRIGECELVPTPLSSLPAFLQPSNPSTFQPFNPPTL